MSGIICLSTVEWDYIWNRPQELMNRFAEQGTRVAYVEPLGIREPSRADWPRIWRRLRAALLPGGQPGTPRATQMHHPRLPTLALFRPLVLPLHGRPWARALNRLLLRRLVADALRWAGPQPLLWTCYATEAVLDVRRLLPGSPTVFDCMDEIALNHKGVARNYRQTEQALLREADEVFVTSSTLLEAKRAFRARIHLISNGGNVEPFAQAPQAEPPEMAALPRPRLLFFGGLDERLDLALLAALAQAHPAWHFVLLGPPKVPLDGLLAHPNVTWLGPKPHAELPPYLAAADVLLIPYRQDGYTHFIYPAKVHECLASGRPTIAAPLPDLQPLAPLVTLAKGVAGWETAIAAALDPAARTPAMIDARRELARQHSWERRFGEICQIVEPLLDPVPTHQSGPLPGAGPHSGPSFGTRGPHQSPTGSGSHGRWHQKTPR
jgi:UDP-galactopyranose mutase